ncbi:MAG: fasciclin domain-containing protein [Rikenellaceae bacterium]
MKNFINNSIYLILGFVSFTLISCDKNVSDAIFYDENDITIFAGLDKNPEYTGMVELIRQAGLNGMLSAYGSYTLFAFDNDALEAYKSENSITSFSDEEAYRLIEYHTLNGSVTTTYMGNGGITTTTIGGDYYSASFTEDSDILINRESIIVERDMDYTNGYLHKLDKVLTPKDLGVREMIFANPETSMFAELWEMSNFDETYDAMQTGSAKSSMTLFIVPDSVYHRHGYNTVQDILDIPCIDNDQDLLNEFVAYHAIPTMSFLNFIENGNYSTCGSEMISLKVSDVYKVNEVLTDDGVTTESYIPIYYEASNYQGSNGVYHSLGDILIPMTPMAEYYFYDFMAQPELMSRSEYGSSSITNIQDWDFSLMSIQITGGTVSYYRSSYWVDQMYYNNTDILFPTGGSWNFEFTTPKVSAGKYRLRLAYKMGSNRAVVQPYFDGVRCGDPINMMADSSFIGENDTVEYSYYFWVTFAELQFDSTMEHTIKLSTVVDGVGCLDGVEFIPIN